MRDRISKQYKVFRLEKYCTNIKYVNIPSNQHSLTRFPPLAARSQGAPSQMTWLKGLRSGCHFFLL